MNYYDIKITGKDVRRFIRNLHKMHINFYNMKYDSKDIIIKVNKSDYLKIKDIKTIYEIEIVKYYGIVKYKHFLNKYKEFLIILLVGFLLFLGLTNIIFEVEVNSNNKELNEILLETLKTKGISKYKLVVGYDKKEKIKKEILKEYKDKIEWLEINRVGTKYVVEVEERKMNLDDLDLTPRDVVAKKNGIITKITSTSGEVVGKIDHYVKKGDILISGSIHKNDTTVATVRADGKIYAETWYTVTVSLPYHYKEETKTGRKETVLNINFLNKNISLFNSKKFENKDSIKLFSIKNFLLPISLSLEKYEEVDLNEGVYTTYNAFFKASDIAKERLIKTLGEDIQIIFEKKLKTDEINSKIEVVIFYKVIEDITDYHDIVLEKENNEEIR